MNKDVTAVVLEHDRRRTPRYEAADGALKFAHDRNDAITCVVKDISDKGARIALVDDKTLFVRKRFRLYIPDKHIMADCETVWQEGNEVGVKFRSLANIG